MVWMALDQPGINLVDDGLQTGWPPTHDAPARTARATSRRW
jgi:hypothetical protein